MIYFHYPENFYWFLPFVGLVGLVFLTRWMRRRDLKKLADPDLLPGLVSLPALKRRRAKDWILLSGIGLLIFASTGPQFGSQLKEVKSRGVEVFIAMDVSRSMLAEDVPPSRLARAKRSLGSLISSLKGNRVGIIAFAKFAMVQCPLTIDTDAARLFLDILDENSVPVQGTSIGEAIRLGVKSFPSDGPGGKVIVLLTDGEDQGTQPIEAAEEAKEKGVVIYTIGIGTTEGDVIKKRDAQGRVSEFHKHKGEMVLSRLDEALLTRVAQMTGGKYYRASSTDKEIEEISEALNGYDKRELATNIHKRFIERYQWFLLIAFLLLLFEFFFGENPGQLKRIKALFNQKIFQRMPLLLLLTLIPAQGNADPKTHVREGNKLAKKGQLKEARGEFKSAQIDLPEEAFIPYNIGNAYYLEGQFEEAKASYETALALSKRPEMRSKIAYNLGHVLFHLGEKEAALNNFKEALRNDPGDVDAKYNIEYIRSGKTPQNPPKPKEQEQKGEGDQSENQQGQSDKGENGENQEQERKDGLDKDEAEQILTMIENQEKERREQRPAARIQKPQEKEAEAYADW